VRVGTIFEDSPIPFTKWLPAIWLLANTKNGTSSHELGRALGVTQKTAWFMFHRNRLAMKAESLAPLSGGAWPHARRDAKNGLLHASTAFVRR
jgi:hypothetical protein